MKRAILLGAVVIIVFSSPTVGQTITSLLPFTTVADESGFGDLYASLSSPFVGGGFSGVLDTRVYVDATPATQVTFVYDLQIVFAISSVADTTIAATGLQNDLRIGEIIAGINGYVTSTTTNAPDIADAINNEYPTADELFYKWLSSDELVTGDVATLYVTTSGNVDVGEVNVAIQNGSTASAMVLAPVDDPSNPDMSVPEPASISLLALGSFALIRRRRRA